MVERDYDEFSALLNDTAALLGRGQQPLSGTARAMFFRALGGFSLDAVHCAMDAHIRDPQRGRFMPTPADLIAQIQSAVADDGRPGADEAWALALAGRDERNTVVWTAEIAEAWGVAYRVLDAGDEVGARVAFRDAYNRLVAEARAARRPLQQIVSEGHALDERAPAIEHAVTAGLLPAPAAAALLPAPEGHTLGSLLQIAPPQHRTRLTAAYQVLAERAKAPSVGERELARTEGLKLETQRMVDAYEGHLA